MRCLAVARYRLLTSVRTAGWIFGGSIAATAVAAIAAALGPGSLELMLLPLDAPQVFAIAARLLEAAYVLHALILLGACHAFGSRRSRVRSIATADLMDAAPVSASARYWGDALGICGAALTIHAATLPALALLLALGPLSLTVFLWLEAAVIALVALESAAGSWKLQASRRHPNTMRAMAGFAAFAILVFAALVWLTRWRDFRDAWAYLLVWPSPVAWSALVDTIDSTGMLALTLAALYAGFLAFYRHRGIRALENA